MSGKVSIKNQDISIGEYKTHVRPHLLHNEVMAREDVQRFLPVLQLIAKIKATDERNQVLRILAKNPAFRKVVKEIATNLYHKQISVPENRLKMIHRHKGVICNLVVKNKKRRNIKLVSQTGGLWPIILPMLLSSLAS